MRGSTTSSECCAVVTLAHTSTQYHRGGQSESRSRCQWYQRSDRDSELRLELVIDPESHWPSTGTAFAGTVRHSGWDKSLSFQVTVLRNDHPSLPVNLNLNVRLGVRHPADSPDISLAQRPGPSLSIRQPEQHFPTFFRV
jgi:hypothetical protein